MKIYIIYIGILVSMLVVMSKQQRELRQLATERDIYRKNTVTALQDVNVYRTHDSLSAATVKALRLTLDEYIKCRHEDAELINTLQVKNRDLTAVASASTETIRQLNGKVRDSIVYIPEDTVTVMARCVDIEDPYITLHGCELPDNRFNGYVAVRDTLLITETVQYRRFLGFLWKTNKVKNCKIDIVSRNPYTCITGFEVIRITR
ncbi:MAG: hypothetical protein NC344_06940 [Bacteroidales bacterium]|nr:hypothetical protein [Bacteroidales bacterium]MCM1147553.1 hypothetical protein [Bacteroidales bacterium]MCM1206343.1 hypothetical protein [Bacillota bacterium]MCM1511228.1 hypothetical protein [Clostridium sp.]